ncbi:MAG: heparinase II/III family protein [Desulfobulbaceae bacterium]|nr:heparinase II/III family protein [Desulfobulbaceae bacterium]
MKIELIHRIRRGVRKPPSVIARRILHEFHKITDHYQASQREKSWNGTKLAHNIGVSDVNGLWEQLAARPYPAVVRSVDTAGYDALTRGDAERVRAAADRALARRVNLLGSGEFMLEKGMWNTDYMTGVSWPNAYCHAIDYNNPDQSSDVKIAWEISRLQWLIPAGQAYLLTGEERWAEGVRDILNDWIDANPYAWNVNWSCTMEVALRIIVWTWFFRVFAECRAWRDEAFRGRFLTCLYLHGDFTERHLERSDINGNHCTADAAGLVFAGLFFGHGKAPGRWADLGWRILCEELPKQVYPDGVDFEASTAYHRLVLELFFFPALFRERCGLEVPLAYKERVIAMARYTVFYSRVDGSIPLAGDADDARTLPFGSQGINDHRYLPGLIGMAWGVSDLIESFSGPRDEIFWWLGPDAADRLPHRDKPAAALPSRAFAEGGFYIMRNSVDHVFIDCGPVGLAGRGGHGHNDCLSFEAVLDNVHLVTDCGAYLYTASYEWRNRFRSTAFHNTASIDNEEQNRFIRPDYLWHLHNDAKPEVRRWETGEERDVFVGAHAGYRRLPQPVVPERSFVLEHGSHRLVIYDRFEGDGWHSVSIPWHLARHVTVERLDDRLLRLKTSLHDFLLAWQGDAAWKLNIGDGWVSPSYGVRYPIVRLDFVRTGTLSPLAVVMMPEKNVPPDIDDWLRSTLFQAGIL